MAGDGSARLAARRVLITGAAFADGQSPELRRGVSVLIENRVVRRIGTDGADLSVTDAEVIDGSGCTLVPAMVDSHSHFTLPGGAQWIDRGADPTQTLLAVAEENGELMLRAGIRWGRDVGAPVRGDPDRELVRALNLTIRDRWRHRRDRPYLRAAGSWLTRSGTLPRGLAVEVDDGDALLAAALGQLDDGADLVKLYLDGPDPEVAPFTVAEVRAVVDAVHVRRARVAAHASRLDPARVGAAGGVDSVEHGFELDADIAATMAASGVTLVSTLGVLHSQLTFVRTAEVPRFRDPEAPGRIRVRLEAAEESVRVARAAGVAIAAGSDFGGGSLRANQLAWEAQALVRAGLEPWEALAALTWRGGDLYGDPAAGRLVEGGPAHFALIHGDPLSDPAALWRVWLTA
jgi:imidazolonepropionase-like amidohydrolase